MDFKSKVLDKATHRKCLHALSHDKQIKRYRFAGNALKNLGWISRKRETQTSSNFFHSFYSGVPYASGGDEDS